MSVQVQTKTEKAQVSNFSSDAVQESQPEQSFTNSEFDGMTTSMSLLLNDNTLIASQPNQSSEQQSQSSLCIRQGKSGIIEEKSSVASIQENKTPDNSLINLGINFHSLLISIIQKNLSQSSFEQSVIDNKQNKESKMPKKQKIQQNQSNTSFMQNKETQENKDSSSEIFNNTTNISNILTKEINSNNQEESEVRNQNSLAILAQLDQVFQQSTEFQQIQSLSKSQDSLDKPQDQEYDSKISLKSSISTKDSVQKEDVIKLDQQNDIEFIFAKQLQKNREFSKAAQKYKTILINLEPIYSKKSLEYAYVLQNLGLAQWNNGYNSQAKQSLLQCLRIRQQLHCAKNISLGKIFTGLVSVEQRLGNFNSSLNHGFKALQIYKENFESQQNKEFAQIYNNFGNTQRFLSRYDEAICYYEKSLAIKKVVFGENDKEYANTLSNIGLTQYKKSMFFEAQKTLEKVLSIYQEDWATSEQKAETMTTLGAILNAMGKYLQAEKTLKEALVLRQEIYGANHIMCGYTLYHLGVTYHKLQRYLEAEDTFRKTLVIFEKFGQKEGRYTAGTLSHLASLYLEKQQFELAINSVDLSLNLYERNPDLDYVKYCSTVNEEGNIYRKMGMNEKAEKCYNQAIKMFEKRKIQDLVENAKLYEDLCILEMKNHNYQQAFDYISKTIRIRQKRYGPQHLETLKAQSLKKQIQSKFS